MLLLSNSIRCAGLLGAVGLIFGSALASGPQSATKSKQLSVPSAQQKLDQASARFIQNSGQWSKKALFLARSQNLNVWLTPQGVKFDYFQQKLTQKKNGRKGQVVTMSFKGGAALNPVGVGDLGFKTQYFKGSASKAQAAGNYHGVVASNVYPGVDLHAYFDHEKPRYDLVVAPKADASAIRLNFHGADKTSVAGNTIKLSTQIGSLSQGKLVAYQMVGSKRVIVPAQFVAFGKNEFGFNLGAYDHSKQLVIDPLVYGSYYGGDGGFDSVNNIVTDNAGGVYLTGYTMAPDFPVIDGPYGYSLHGGKDVFVAKLQGDAYNEDYAAYVGGTLDDNSQYIAVDPFGDIWIAGRTFSSDFPGNEVYQRPNVQFLTQMQGFPPVIGGTFQLSYQDNTGSFTTANIKYNATPAQVQAALVAAAGAAGASITVTSNLGLISDKNSATYRISLPWNLPGMLSVNPFTDTTIEVNPFFPPIPPVIPAAYGVTKYSDIFVMRFQQSSTTVLDPTTVQAVRFFGGDYAETLAGFSIMPQANPATTDPVILAFGGTVASSVPDISGYPGGQVGYIAKYAYSGTSNAFTMDSTVSRYVAGGNGIDLTGIALDFQGSTYVGGTVHFNGNVDTSQAPGNTVFTTTSGVFPNGQLIRNDDLFVQKYFAGSGTLAYSAVIGGSDYDNAGGLDFDLDGTTINTGNCIAVDSNLDLYIVGVSGSFNFPRTRGVFGEVFTNAANVTVTKINSDASKILYSTNLQTSGLVNPSGISLDARGDAFITGNVHADYYLFPDSFSENPANAANPNVPAAASGTPMGAIQTTSDALVPTNLQPGSTMPTVKGFLNILDPAADKLVFGTYLGGPLETRVFGPYVDSFGDVWVNGWYTDQRIYVLFDSSGNPHVYADYASDPKNWLPAAMISPQAFKSTPDAHGDQTIAGVLYGILSPSYPFYIPWSWAPSTTAPGGPVPTVDVDYRMDGWLDKLRVGLASVDSLTVSPTTVPGGLGESTTGTVTLTQNAPTGGADIVLTLLNSTTAASFSSVTQQSTLVVTIPGGSKSATFTVYTEAVPTNTPVEVQASYQGSFQIGLFTVTPWLQQLSLTPTSVVGGNAVSGRITLAATPPTGSGGVNVTVLTNNPAIVSFPGGATVNVPEGQSSVTFTINTAGVGVISYPTITASLLGVGVTETLTVSLAGLQTMSFNPPSVAAGTPSIGTIALNGQATGPFVVNLTSADPSYTFADAETGAPITSLTFLTGDSAKSFTVVTPYEAANTQDVITATVLPQGNYPFQTISSTLYVTAINLTGLSVTPKSPSPGINGGSTATGTVTIGQAAPTGGVVVNLASSNTSVATVPATVTVPAGATSATFTINTSVVPATATAVISASRGATTYTSTLTVNGVTFAVSLSSYSVVGGISGSVTGTVTLANPAPAATGLALTVTLPVAQDTFAYFGLASGTSTATVFVAGGATSGTFTVNTSVVPATQEVPISVYVQGGTPPATPQVTLEVRVVGVASLKFTPTMIRGNNLGVTYLVITLDAPAPAGGTVVTISQSQPLLHLAASYTIPAGSLSYKVPTGITAVAVSRPLADVVTATPPNGGGSASAVVIVNR